ncbi:MAG TPA: ribosome biogenesis GTPase YlqF [Candidatus Baltobacteraceae bacterium]|jgi:ribosome biogenesis GTPase A|nr:ribosome biogenesis GTPase YlqF [Candidatus Baltobacteraceae bacterium]
MRPGDPIQWYPGHMAKAMRRLAEDLRIANLVIEVVDARVPQSGTNPHLRTLLGKRPCIRVLAREDLADPHATRSWLARFAQESLSAIALDAKRRFGIVHLQKLIEETSASTHTKARRIIVVGIPNAGKSTVINALVGRSIARAEDRAGVTRAPQWFRIGPQSEVMDTAGILAPSIDTREAQWRLAIVGAVPRARYDAEEVVANFSAWCRRRGTGIYAEVPDLESYAQTRGFVRHGMLADVHNAAWSYLKDVSDLKFGRITLEFPT